MFSNKDDTAYRKMVSAKEVKTFIYTSEIEMLRHAIKIVEQGYRQEIISTGKLSESGFGEYCYTVNYIKIYPID